MPSSLLLLLVSVSSMAVGALLLLYWAVPRLERSYVFRPSRTVRRTPAAAGIPFDRFLIETPDGCRLSAWSIRPPSPLAQIVYFHGNSGNLGLLIEVLAQFYQHGLSVLAFDYRGYGSSTGVPCEEGLYRDGLAVSAFHRKHLSTPGLPTIFWGRSLGGPVAATVAGQVRPQGLVLETTFLSKSSLVKHYPSELRFFNIFSRVKLETARALRTSSFPILVIHGDQDQTVPLAAGQALYRKLRGPKEFFRVEGADHVNIHSHDAERYMRRVLKFVTRLGGKKRPTEPRPSAWTSLSGPSEMIH